VSEILQSVTLERVISKPGVISVAYDYRIPDNLTGLSVSFGDNWTEIHTEGFEIDGSTCEWRDGGTQRPSIELKFKVDSDIGASSYVDTGEWAITRLPNIGWSWRYRGGSGGPEIRQEFEVRGEGAVSSDGAVAYLGPYKNYTERARDTGEQFRLVIPRDATLRDEPQSILRALTHASEYLDIGALNDSVLAIAAPTTAQNWASKGSQRGDDGFWVRDDAVTDETNETWVHEYVHTRQRFIRTSGTYWFQEGTADYFAALAALERGEIKSDEFHQFLTSTHDRNAKLSDTSTWRSSSTAYRRGRHACAALDERIRKDSDGSNTLMGVLEELNRRFEGSEKTPALETQLVRDAVETITGRNMDSWFQKHVHGARIPEIDTDPSVFLEAPVGPDTGVKPDPEPVSEPDPEPVSEPEPSHRCPICNKTTTDDYCPVCGYEFVSGVTISDSDPQVNECPICEQKSAERFCPICGYEFESPKVGDQRESEGGDTESGSNNTCPVCGSDSDKRFCPTCGHEMRKSGSGQPVDTSTETSGVRMCEICHTITNRQLCPTCGREVE